MKNALLWKYVQSPKPCKGKKKIDIHDCTDNASSFFNCSDAESSHMDEENDFETEDGEDMGNDEETKAEDNMMDGKTGWDSTASS